MSDNSHYLDLIPAYVLGCLEADEVARVAEHLAVCPACRAELDSYRQLSEHLAYAVPEAQPAPELQQKLIKQIQSPQTKNQSRPSAWQGLINLLGHPKPIWGLIGGGVILILILGNIVLQPLLKPPLPTPRPDVMQTIPLFPTEAAPGAHGMIVISLDGYHGALVIEDLTPLDPGYEYQLWFAQDDQRTSATRFSVDSSGYEALAISAPIPLNEYSGFGITIEPAGGSDTPHGNRVLRWGTEKGK